MATLSPAAPGLIPKGNYQAQVVESAVMPTASGRGECLKLTFEVADQETADLMLLIRAIQARGVTVLLIEHDMNLVMKICDKLVVLEYGAVIAEGVPGVIKKDPAVIEAYLGKGKHLGTVGG